MKAAQLSSYPASSPTHGTATLGNLDKLIQNLEFENKQQVKLIEKENEEREELDRQTKEKREEIARMQKAISQMDEDTKRLHRQFKYNRDNVGSLKRTCQLLYEHEEALKHKLKEVTSAGEKQTTDCAKMLEHFQNVWAKHQEVYESMPKVKSLREKQSALRGLQDTIKQAIQRIEQLNRTIRSLENPTEEDEQMPVFPHLQSCIIKLAELKVDSTKNLARVKEMQVNIKILAKDVEEKTAERDRIVKEREAELQRRQEEVAGKEREKRQLEERQEKDRQMREQQEREKEAQQHTLQQEATSQYFPLISAPSQNNSVAASSLHPGAPPSVLPAPGQGTTQFPGLTSAGLGAKGAFPLVQPVQRKSPPKLTIPTLMTPLPRHTPQPRQVPSFNFQNRQLPPVQQKAPLLQVYRPNMPVQQPLLRQVQELQLRQKIELQPTGHSPTKGADNQALEGSPARMGDNQEQKDEEDSTVVMTNPMTPGLVHLSSATPDNTCAPVTPGHSAPVTPGHSAPVTPANSNPSTPGEETGHASTSPFNMEKHRQHLLQLTSTSPGFSIPSRPMYQAEGGEEEAQANAGGNIKVEEISPFMQSFFTGFGGEPVAETAAGSVPSMPSPEQQPPNTSTSAGSPGANPAPEKAPTSKGPPFFKGATSPPSVVSSFASMTQSAGTGVSSSAASFFGTQNTSTSASDSFSLGSVTPMSSGAASLFGGGESTTTTPANDGGGSFFAGFGGTGDKSSSACNLFSSGNLFGGGDNSPGSNSPEGFSFNFGGGGGSSPNSEAGTSGFSLFG